MAEGDVIAVGVIVLFTIFLGIVLNGFQPVDLQVDIEELRHVGHGRRKRVIQPGGGDEEQDIGKERRLAVQHQRVAHDDDGCQPQPEEHLPGGDQTGGSRFRGDL